PQIPVLVLAGGFEDDCIRAAIDAGARGYIDPSTESDYLQLALMWLAQGFAVLDPLLTRGLISWLKTNDVETETDVLSEREVEVLRYVMRGEPNKRIARFMGL